MAAADECARLRRAAGAESGPSITHARSPRHHEESGLASVRLPYDFDAAADARRAQVIMSYASWREARGDAYRDPAGEAKPKDQAFLDHVGAEFQKTITAEIEKLRQMLEGQNGRDASKSRCCRAGGALFDPTRPCPLTIDLARDDFSSS